jgi:hypothetical protein
MPKIQISCGRKQDRARVAGGRLAALPNSFDDVIGPREQRRGKRNSRDAIGGRRFAGRCGVDGLRWNPKHCGFADHRSGFCPGVLDF